VRLLVVHTKALAVVKKAFEISYVRFHNCKNCAGWKGGILSYALMAINWTGIMDVRP